MLAEPSRDGRGISTVDGGRYAEGMAGQDDGERFHAETREAWRAWLTEHQARSAGVWLISWRTPTGRPRLSYDESIMEALAVGWIDGQAGTLDGERRLQWFAPRRPSSSWSAVNKERVERVEAEGIMQAAGRASIELAKANGMWSVLDEADALIEPPELAALLDADPAARANWNAFPASARKWALSSIALAKRADTRARRVAETARQAAAGERPGPR
jgi:uncharacterized protein YdeI (YjbR/CyaY-like superfamily)